MNKTLLDIRIGNTHALTSNNKNAKKMQVRKRLAQLLT